MTPTRSNKKRRFKAIFVLLLLSYCIPAIAQRLPRLIPYRDGNQWGYCDTAGIVKIKPQWDDADLFCGGKAVVTIYDKQAQRDFYCLIDEAGNYIIPPSRHWNRCWSGWKTTMLNAHDDGGQYGLIDTNNRLLLPCVYDRPIYEAKFLSDRYRSVSLHDAWGLVNNKSEVLIPLQYEKLEELPAHDHTMPAFKVLEKGVWRLLDLHGSPILPDAYNNIFPNSYWSYPQHVRNGYLLEQQRLADPGDSSRGMSSILGWVDYPGNKYIAPRYKSFAFLSDRLYAADDRLYYENGKPALPVRYKGFYRIGDTLFCTVSTRLGKDSIEYAHCAFEIQTLSLLKEEKTKARYYPEGTKRERPWMCGTGIMMARQEEEREARRPFLQMGKEAVKDFVRDDVNWHTNFYLGKDRVSVYGYPVHGGITLQGVTDKQGHFLFPPFPATSSIAAINLEDRLLILRTSHVQNSSTFAVADLAGNFIVPFGEQILSYAFRDSSRKIIVVAAKQLPSEGQQMGFPGDVYEESAVVTPRNARLCDQSLTPIPALRAYFFRELVDAALNASTTYTGYIEMADTARHTGYINLKGTVLLHPISFRYRNLVNYGEYVFMAGNDATHSGKLIDRNNTTLTKDAVITGVRVLSKDQQQHTELFYPASTKDLSLMQVYYKNQTARYNYQFFYMDESGRVFAGKL